MTREQKVSTLIQYLKQENQGYASIPDPIDEGEQRRLLRSLMNVLIRDMHQQNMKNCKMNFYRKKQRKKES